MRRRHGGQHAFSPNLSAARSASPSTNKSINGKVCTRRMILEHVWGPGYEKQLHYLKVYASFAPGLRGGYGIRVIGGQEHFLRAGFGCGPRVRLDERRRPVFPRLLARLAWFLDRGVDELLDGALAEEPACPAFGIQDAGTAPDAELWCFRPGKPDSVPDAELLVSGKMDRDRLLDAAGCGAEPGMR